MIVPAYEKALPERANLGDFEFAIRLRLNLEARSVLQNAVPNRERVVEMGLPDSIREPRSAGRCHHDRPQHVPNREAHKKIPPVAQRDIVPLVSFRRVAGASAGAK
jgi:hypothetical protein